MDFPPTLGTGTVLVIVGVTLISGPLVPSIDFTSKPETPDFGTEDSSADISIVDFPESSFTIAPGRMGTGPYLYSPPVTVIVENVSGSPVLIYEVKINRLQFLTARMVFLTDRVDGKRLTINIDRYSLDPNELREQNYAADVSLRIRTGNHTRSLYENTVRVSVQVNATN